MLSVGRNIVGISLGKDCLAASFGVFNKIRLSKIRNYKTCPFDLMISNYEGIIKCILEDFKNFTNPEFLIYDGNIILNNYYNFKFNHETPNHGNLCQVEKWIEGENHFINNNFFNFIKRYDDRILNFKNYLNDKRNFIKFIISIDDKNIYENNCKDLKEAIYFKYPKLKYSIIIIEGPFPHDINKTNIIKIL